MPRPRTPAAAVAGMPDRVYSPVAERLAAQGRTAAPLHVGDTWLEPFPGARMQDLDAAGHPEMHRYGPTRGIPPLIDAIVDKVRHRNGIPVEREGVWVSGGATGALACAVGAIVDPGEQVLILAPFWPLIRGAVQAMRGEAVEVPFHDRVHGLDEAIAAVEARIGPRSVALYVSSPSNPTGRVLPRAWLEGLAELARRHDLWLLSDEVYEEIVYRGEHVSLAPFAPERTLTAFSFSKTYGMAGNRVGYLVGPASIVDQAEKVGVHTFYHPPTPGQIAALRALADGADWVAQARDHYRAAGEDAARVLGQAPPEGSTFLFVDVAPHLDARGMDGFLADCAEEGVLVAPGGSCGVGYETHVRLCYTSAPPDQVAQAVRTLARRLGRGVASD